MRIHHHHHFEGESEILRRLDLILANQEAIMTAFDDFKAAIADLISEAVTDLEAAIAKIQPGVSDADLVAQTQAVKDATAKLKADFAAVPGAPKLPPAGT